MGACHGFLNQALLDQRCSVYHAEYDSALVLQKMAVICCYWRTVRQCVNRV